MTDNGSYYRSHAFAKACKVLGLQHLGKRPYPPRTNHKAQRFIQPSHREWPDAGAHNFPEVRSSSGSQNCSRIRNATQELTDKCQMLPPNTTSLDRRQRLPILNFGHYPTTLPARPYRCAPRP